MIKKNAFWESLLLYLEKYPPAQQLITELYEIGDLYFIGGVLREYKDNNAIKSLRDIDIVIKPIEEVRFAQISEKYAAKRNQFDGYKMICSGFEIDVWLIQQTWAYRTGSVTVASDEEMLVKLQDTVFLNMDAIIYDIKKDIWYDSVYQNAKDVKILDVVLEENPKISLNLLRAMILKRQYQMEYSTKLLWFYAELFQTEKSPLDMFLDIQQKRYHKEILSENEIKQEITYIKSQI